MSYGLNLRAVITKGDSSHGKSLANLDRDESVMFWKLVKLINKDIGELFEKTFSVYVDCIVPSSESFRCIVDSPSSLEQLERLTKDDSLGKMFSSYLAQQEVHDCVHLDPASRIYVNFVINDDDLRKAHVFFTDAQEKYRPNVSPSPSQEIGHHTDQPDKHSAGANGQFKNGQFSDYSPPEIHVMQIRRPSSSAPQAGNSSGSETRELKQTTSDNLAKHSLPKEEQQKSYAQATAVGLKVDDVKHSNKSEASGPFGKSVYTDSEYIRSLLDYADDGSFKTAFVLYIPKKYSVCEASLLHAIGDRKCVPVSLALQKNGLWCSHIITVRKLQKYKYKIKYSIWLGARNTTQEELSFRQIEEIPVHRDLFTEKQVSAGEVSDAYLLLIPHLISDVQMNEDLIWALEEYQRKHAAIIHASDLAVSVTSSFLDLQSSINEAQAAFVVYFLSACLPNDNSWSNCKLKRQHAKLLLSSLQSFPLEQQLAHIKNFKAVVNTLRRMLIFCETNCSWLHLLHYCFPTLSPQTILDMIKGFPAECRESGTMCKDVVAKLCSALDEPGVPNLLCAVVKKTKRVDLMRMAYIAMIDYHCTREIIQIITETFESNNFPRWTSAQHMEEIHRTAVEFVLAESELQKRLAPGFEKAVIKIISKKDTLSKESFAADNLCKLVTVPFLFVDKEPIEQLLSAIAGSNILDFHRILPDILIEAHFVHQSSPQLLSDFVHSWVDTYCKSDLQAAEMDVVKHFQYLTRIVNVPIFKEHPTVYSCIRKTVMTGFCLTAVKIMKRFSSAKQVQFLESAANLFDKPENTELHDDSLRHELELAVCKIVKINHGWESICIKNMVDLIQNTQTLFTHKEAVHSLLHALLDSRIIQLHKLVATVMDQKGNLIPAKDAEAIFSKWLSGVTVLCWEAARKMGAIQVGVAYIICLFDYLYPAHCNPSIREKVEDILKEECRKERKLLGTVLHSSTDIMAEPAMDFMKTTIREILAESVTPMKDLVSYLMRCIDDKSSKNRPDTFTLQLYLDQMQTHYSQQKSDIDRELFFLRNESVWIAIRQKVIKCDLVKHEIISLMQSRMKSFAGRLAAKNVSVQDFNILKKFVETEYKEGELRLISEFCELSLQQLISQTSEVVEGARSQLQRIITLYKYLLHPFEQFFQISDVHDVKKELIKMNRYFEPNSICVVSEIHDFSHLGLLLLAELSPSAKTLQPFCTLKTFVALCKSMMVEESECTSADVADFLIDEGIVKYKQWLESITDCALITDVLQFDSSVETTCGEIKIGAGLVGITVAQTVTESLTWFRDLASHRLNIHNIEKLFVVFNIKLPGTPLGDVVNVFFKCLNNPETVTVKELREAMASLQEVLSVKDDYWWSVVEELSNAAELVNFVRVSIDDDFRILIDAVEERSEQTIDETTVSDLIRVKRFLQPVLTKSYSEPMELIASLRDAYQGTEESKELSTRINTCCLNVHGLKALYQHVADRGELTKEIIANAMKCGHYEWNLDKTTTTCTAKLSYVIKKGSGQEDFHFSLEELLDMKSRVLLISASDRPGQTENMNEEQQKDDMKQFVSIVDKVQDIAHTVTKLHDLGHFSYQKYYEKVITSDKILVELAEILTSLESEFEQWTQVLSESRGKHLSLNFLFSDQLSTISDYLFDESESLSANCLDSLLYYVHPDAKRKDIVKPTIKPTDMLSKLCTIGVALDQLKDTVDCSRRKFPDSKEFSRQARDVNAIVAPGKLMIAHLETGSTQTIPVLLSLYANTMKQFPLPNEVLFCHENTSWEELYLIVQRCVMTSREESSLHCIINVEKLPNNLQYRLVDELSTLLSSLTHPNYRLAIICQGGTHHPIIDHFSACVHHIHGFDSSILTTCLQETWPNISMITSSVPGLGKTEQIFSLAAESGHFVNSIHISGPISRELLVARLQSCTMRSNTLLHFDISEVSDAAFLDAAIFEFIFVGCLCSSTQIICLPGDNIAFEVANTVGDRLRDSLVVLSCFKRTHIQWENYKNYKVSAELTSPIQVVCRYLEVFENGQLDSVDIKITGVKPLAATACQSLLRKHFSTTPDISFAIVEVFLNVLACQLRKFTGSVFLTIGNLKAMVGDKEPLDIRSKLTTALIDVAKEFACRSVQSCRSAQKSAQLVELGNKSAGSSLADDMASRVDGMLQWADSNHLIVAFHGLDAQTVSVLYRDLKQVPEHVKKLFKSQTRKDLEDINSLPGDSLRNILVLLAQVSCKQLESSKSLHLAYALTPDNLLKMVLILLRIRASIPVIIMGETGCGKTSLIRYLADTCGSQFVHVNIHAGITETDIVDAVMKNNAACRLTTKKQIWLFLDEINTCNHMGLLTEIICRHQCYGQQLAHNLVFIAACNPYRLREQHKIVTAGLQGKIKIDEYAKLVYRVHPLPERMIDYVWDYGVLNPTDEESYIKEMIRNVLPTSAGDLTKKTVALLVTSQEFTRQVESNGWCVSLRDVNRCRVLIQYFIGMLKEKAKFALPDSKPSDDLNVRAVALALAHCYVSRIATNKQRQKYWKSCAKILFGSEEQCEKLARIVREEQMELLHRMDTAEGIAKNTALRENVFVILVCILNRIPVFLVGKPGCSKSLSVQLIKSNLRGKDSKDPYFRTLPNLYIVSYQGSESSTSEGIAKVFVKAEKYKKANEKDNVLPVVLLDEVGLAEASKFNPLKVLHSLLEPNTGELPNVAVVGISNWALDAAKMNRAIYLSRPDMDAEDLYETGVSIATIQPKQSNEPFKTLRLSLSLAPILTVTDSTLRALANAYYDYQSRQKIKNFHGLRDYYSLIKYVSRAMHISGDDDNDEKYEMTVIQKGLLRNFGGLTYESKEIMQHFLKAIGGADLFSWTVEEIVKDNLSDLYARHLMLITNGDSALGVIAKQLSVLDRKVVVIFGSKFDEDQTEDYSYRILNRIILSMESGCALILKDLDSIYGSLYDMLNQNYTVVGKKKNCRIALGPYSNPMCQVHDEFRCIVLVEEGKVDFSDPPFLNRFEKQVVRFDDIISEEENQLISKLNGWMDAISSVQGLTFKKEHVFMGLNIDTVPSLVYQYSQREYKDGIIDDCKSALLWLMLPDAVIRASQSKLATTDGEEVERLQQSYFRLPVHERLTTVMSEVECNGNSPPSFIETSGFRLVIYTHSNIHFDVCKVLDEFEPITVEKLGAFKSEKQLTIQLRHFFESDAKLLVLQCRPSEDEQHIPLAKFQVEELQQQFTKTTTVKHICMIMHLERDAAETTRRLPFSYLSGWRLMTVDSLEDPGEFTIPCLLKKSASELLESDFKPIRNCVLERLLWSFSCTSSSYFERSIEEIAELIKQISASDRLISLLSQYILDILKSESSDDSEFYSGNFASWLIRVARDVRLLCSSTSFIDALRQFLTQWVATPLANIVYRLESFSAWHSYFVNDGMHQELWELLFQKKDVFALDGIQPVQGPGTFRIDHKPLNLCFPFSQIFINKLCQNIDFFKHDLMEAENYEINLNKNGELKDDAYEELFGQYRDRFTDDLQVILPTDNFSQHVEDFVSDICNFLVIDHIQDEKERIQVTEWFVGYKCHRHETSDAITAVTEPILCIWRYDELLHAILQLVAECRVFLPCTVEEMLTRIRDVSVKQCSKHKADDHPLHSEELTNSSPIMPQDNDDDTQEEANCDHEENVDSDKSDEETGELRDSLHDDHDAEETNDDHNENMDSDKTDEETCDIHGSLHDDVEDAAAESEVEDDPDMTLHHESLTGTNLPGLSPEPEDVSNEEDAEQLHSDAADEQEAVEAEIEKPDELEPDQNAESTENKEDDDMSVASGKSEIATEEPPHELSLHQEELLIHLMCNYLIPNEDLFQECGGIDTWQMRVCSVLSFCSVVSGFPRMIHVLRVFNDLAMILLHSQLEKVKVQEILCMLSSCIKKEDYMELAPDTADMFDSVLEILGHLKDEKVASEEIQHFLCMYVGRCLETDSESDIIVKFLDQIVSGTAPDTAHSFVETILLRLVLALGDDLFSKFVDYIQDENQPEIAECFTLQQLDSCLASVEQKSDLFVVLCVDVIENLVFSRHSWEDLQSVESPGDTLIVACKASADVLDSSPVCLRFVVAAAYIRVFFCQLSHLIEHDYVTENFGSHQMLYQNVNSVVDQLFETTVPEYMIKELRSNGVSLQYVRKIFKRAEEVLPCLQRYKWTEDEVTLSLGYNAINRNDVAVKCSALRPALLATGKDSKEILDYIQKNIKTPEGMLVLIEAVAHTVYLPCSLRPLKDTEKQIGDWMSAQSKLLGSPLDQLICRLAAKESFGVGLLRITPNSVPLQVQQAAFILRLMSVTLARRSEAPFNVFWRCMSPLKNPEDKSLLEFISLVGSQDTSAAALDTCGVVGKYVNCRCWSRLFISSALERCPLCDVEWHRDITDNFPKAASSVTPNSVRPEIIGCARDVLAVLLYSSVLSGCAIGLTKDSDLAAAFSDSELNSIENVSTLYTNLWKSLEDSLQLTSDQLAIFLCSALDKWNVVGKKLTFQGKCNVPKLTDEVQQLVVKHVLTRSLHSDTKTYLSSITCADDNIKQFIYEIPMTGSDSSSSVYQLFRQTKGRTLEDMKSKFYLTCASGIYPVIETFFEMAPRLRLLCHLLPVLKWTLLCHRLISHNRTRDECKLWTLGKLIHTESEEDSKCYGDCFSEFCDAWEELRGEENIHLLASIDTALLALPQIHRNALVQTCTVDSTNSVVYRVLSVLRCIHNTFLDQLLVIATSLKCPAVSFLRKQCKDVTKDGVTAVKCILLQNVKEHQLARCDDDDLADLMMFAQNDLHYGRGNEIHYDFLKIENEIANRLALGKTYIVLNVSFPLITYANELFVACASVLREFAALVPQEPLKPAMRTAIDERRKADADYIQQLMRQTEILLCVAKRTGGAADQTLAKYVHNWLRTLPGGFAGNIFPSGMEPLRMSHLVALYEYVEDLQTDVVIESLSDEFRQLLPDTIRDELKQFVNTNHVPLETFRMALRRFVMRNVAHFDTKKVDPKQPLSTWMTEPSLWPDYVKDDGTLTQTEGTVLPPKNLKDEFPQMPNLEHVFNTVKLIDFLIKERSQKLRFVPPASKVSATPSVAKQAARGTRTGSKAVKLGRT